MKTVTDNVVCLVCFSHRHKGTTCIRLARCGYIIIKDATKGQDILATAPKHPPRASAVKNVEQVITNPTEHSTTSTRPPPLKALSSDKDDGGFDIEDIDGCTSDDEDDVAVAATSSGTTVKDKSKTELPTYSSPSVACSCITDIHNQSLQHISSMK